MTDLVLRMFEAHIQDLGKRKQTPETLARLSETVSLRLTYTLIREHERMIETGEVIEMDERADYGTIHKAGCRDVRDPMPVDNDDPDDSTGWGLTADEYYRAPCVK